MKFTCSRNAQRRGLFLFAFPLVLTACMGPTHSSDDVPAPSEPETHRVPQVNTEDLRHGQIHITADNETWAWDSPSQSWLTVEDFWLADAERRGGLTWGRRSDYPAYAAVSELDTIIIELDSGPCLMTFFHSRWRRANDVWRWDVAFNEFGGCPHVFD